MMEDEETTNRESSLLPHEAATGKPPPDPLAASLEKVGALSVEHARRMVRSTETSRRSREGGSASAIMSQLSLASEHAREIVGSILDGKAMGGEEAPSFQRPPHQLSDSQACGSPTPEAELRPCQGGEGEAWQDAAGKSSPPLSPAHTRMVPAEVVEQLQRQQQQRLEEMAEGARQLTRQKDKEIKQLTESMQAMLKEAAEREETAFRRAEESERARSRMEEEYRTEMLKFQSEVQKLHRKLDMRSLQEREELAKRVQGALDSVREAAENDIEEMSRERDHWQQECMKLEEETRSMKAAQEHQIQSLKQQLATEGAKLAMARDEISSVTMKRNHEVSEIKSKLEMIVRQTKLKESQLQDEISRLSTQVKGLQEVFEFEKSSIESEHSRQIEILQSNNSALEEELESMKQRVHSLQIAMEGRYRSVQENAQSLERAMDVSSQFSRQQADQNNKLLELVAQLQHERSLAESEIHFLRSDRERLLVEAEELQREIGRLDKLVYGKGNTRSKSKLKFPEESTNGIAWESSRELLNGTILPNKSSSSSSFPRLAWQP